VFSLNTVDSFSPDIRFFQMTEQESIFGLNNQLSH